MVISYALGCTVHTSSSIVDAPTSMVVITASPDIKTLFFHMFFLEQGPILKSIGHRYHTEKLSLE